MAYGTEIFPQQHRIFFQEGKKIFNREPTNEVLMTKNRTFLKKVIVILRIIAMVESVRRKDEKIYIRNISLQL